MQPEHEGLRRRQTSIDRLLHQPHATRLFAFSLVGCLVLLSNIEVVEAQTLRAALSKTQAYADEEIQLEVYISGQNAAQVTPDVPEIRGLAVNGPFRPTQRWTNGRFSISMTYLLKPLAAQRQTFQVGPITGTVGTRTIKSQDALTLEVYRRPPLNVRFRVDLQNPSGGVAEPFRVKYTISYSGARNDEFGSDSFFDRRSAFGLTALEIPLIQQSGVLLFPAALRRDSTQVKLEKTALHIVEDFETNDQGEGFRTLSFAFDVVPLQVGSIECGQATAGLALATGVEKRRRNRAFGLQGRVVEVPVFKDFRAQIGSVIYRVEEPPRHGQPPTYNGAVGKYSVEVETPTTEVDAFAPLTLQVRVTSQNGWGTEATQALLENLSQPLWARDDTLTKDFDVSGDMDPGVVGGKTKTFRLRLRPQGKHVKAIPPIAFPSYDSKSRRYEIFRSQPIPITVREVKTVSANDAIVSERQNASTATSIRRPNDVESIGTRTGIAANFATIGQAQSSFEPTRAVLSRRISAVLVVPPLLFAAAVIIRRRQQRAPETTLKDRALSRALGRLSDDAELDDAATAFRDYFSERAGVARGELTPGELKSTLEEHGVSSELADEALQVLESFLSGRFGGGSRDVPVDRARDVLKRLNPLLK